MDFPTTRCKKRQVKQVRPMMTTKLHRKGLQLPQKILPRTTVLPGAFVEVFSSYEDQPPKPLNQLLAKGAPAVSPVKTRDYAYLDDMDPDVLAQ